MTTVQFQSHSAARPSELRTSRERVKAALAGLLAVLAESARAAEHRAIFAHQGDAQFAALTRRQQNALLDRGLGPR